MSKHKRLTLPFLLKPPLTLHLLSKCYPPLLPTPFHSPAITLSPLPPPHTHHPFQRYMKAMCGSGWLCELGARPHLRSCAEGAHCVGDVVLLSPSSFSSACTSSSSPPRCLQVTTDGWVSPFGQALYQKSSFFCPDLFPGMCSAE